MTTTAPGRTVRLKGDLTIATALETKILVLEALAAGVPMVVDLSEVDEFDTAGLQLLLALRREADVSDTQLEVIGSPDTVTSVLERVGLTADLRSARSVPTATHEEDPDVRG